MNCSKKVLVLIFVLCVLLVKSQQNSRKKIGLCLSGGGAKGLAHIGLLKLIDSLEIKVDYITGTSMGGVIGALYASGYTGKQIDSLAHRADWDVLLSQYVPLNEIYSDEKDEYGRYIGEIPIRNKQPFITGIIEGQKLLSFLSYLTRHVNTVTDFKDLPIPYKCMAVDIISAQPVVLDHGNLALAMRATMSIPTIFKPVKIDNKLLVDGGLMVNFPVKELKEMGADVIIGSYTGGKLMNEKEMNTVNKLLIQTSSFYGIRESKDNMEACTIFNNLNDSMKVFKAGDFVKSEKIMEAGTEMAYHVLPRLAKLAAEQKASGLSYKKKTLVRTDAYFKINSIVVDSSTKQLEKFIRKRFTFRAGDSVKFDEVETSISRLYGTRNFFKAYYELTPLQDGSFNLAPKVEPDVTFRVKGTLHFDTELGTGVIVNVTARNWLGKNSRLLATADLAQAPRYRVHYRKYFKQSNLSYNINFLRVRAIQPLEFDSAGQAQRDYSILYRNFGTGFNYNLNISSSIYVGVIGEIHEYKPKYDNGDIPVNMGVSIKRLSDLTTGFNFQYRFNTFDRVVFPKKGVDLFVENKLTLLAAEEIVLNSVLIDSLDQISLMEQKSFSNPQPYNKLFLRCTGLIPIHKQISITTSINLGLVFQKVLTLDYPDSLSSNTIPLSDGYYVGGAEQRSRPNQIPFMGIKEGQLDDYNSFATLQLGLQLEVLPKLFVTPAFNYYYSANTPDDFFKYISKIDLEELATSSSDVFQNTYTYGINFGYRSLIGPINLVVSKNQLSKKPMLYFTLGYKF